MNRKIVLGICILISLVLSSFAGFAADKNEDELSQILFEGLSDESKNTQSENWLMSSLEYGIQESLSATKICNSPDENGRVECYIESDSFSASGDAGYDSGLTAPYCSDADSPCIADSSLLKCRDSVNDGNGPEPNQPNTIDSCSDGTSTSESPSCGGDESVENITITSLNGTKIKAGDTVNVTAWVNCWTGGSASDNINFVYTNSTSSINWQVKGFVSQCPSGGYNQLSQTFKLDNVEGNHSVRVIIQYEGSTSATCGTGSYDDTDDVVFYAGPKNTPPSSPNSITCNGGNCSSSFSDNVTVQCSGSSDNESDTVTYEIDAYYSSEECANNGSCENCSSQTNCSDCGTAGCSWISETDKSEIYYFNSWNDQDSWDDSSPDEIVDGSISTSSADNNDGHYVHLNSNNCSGYDLGEIKSVEVRAYFENNWATNKQTRTIAPNLKPYFNSTQSASDYSYAPCEETGCAEGHWGSWIDITEDANAPAEWTWEDVKDLDIRVISDRPKSGMMKVYKIELRVNYSSESCSGILDCSNYENQTGCESCTSCEWKNEKEWTNIGSHTENSSFVWNISSIEPQSEVDLRCRAIDLAGSNNYSVYYNPLTNLTVSNTKNYISVSEIKPEEYSVHEVYEDIIIGAHVQSSCFIDKVFANISVPSGGQDIIELVSNGQVLDEVFLTNFSVENTTIEGGSYNVTFKCHDFTDGSDCTIKILNASGNCMYIMFDDEPDGGGDFDLDIESVWCIEENQTYYRINFTKIGYEAAHNVSAGYILNTSFGVDSDSGFVINKTESEHFELHMKTINYGAYYSAKYNNSIVGVYNASLIANNTCSMTNNTEITIFEIADLSIPEVTQNHPYDGYSNISNTLQEVEFSCSAEDNYNLSNISLYLTDSNNMSFVVNQTKLISGKNGESSWILNITDGAYTWNCLAYDSSENFDWGENRTLNIEIDDTPPGKISNIKGESGDTWVYWNWTNPADSDFSHSIIYLNGENIVNTSNNSINFTGLDSFELFKIEVYTADETGNINTHKVQRVERTKGKKIKINFDVKNSKNRIVNSNITIFDVNGTQYSLISNSSLNITQGFYDVIIKPEDHPAKTIYIRNATLKDENTTLMEIESISKLGAEQEYSINPTINFTNATITATAKGEELYKCVEWNFTEQECYGNWTRIMSITPNDTYQFMITPVDPGFAEVVSACSAEDNEQTKGTFAGACDDPTGGNLEKDDGTYETHAYSKNKYGGVRIQSVNTSITDCGSIDQVLICYEWWAAAGDTLSDCDVSVDANGGGSYSAATTTCPGTTANPGLICANVTSLETWTCGNFFGTAGTRAYAKSELTRTNGGASNIATWDALYFNVTYTETDTTPPSWSQNKTSPSSPAVYAPGQNYQFNITWTDDTAIDTVFIEHNFTGTLQNYTVVTSTASEYYYNYSDLPAGSYVWKEYANDTSNNKNQTDQWVYTVNKADQACSLTFAPSSPITYNTTVNASCSCTGESSISLIRNGTDVTSENNQFITLGAGTYLYNCSSSETQNYTSAQNTSAYTVNKNSSIVSLLLNGTEGNINITQFQTVNITGQLTYPSQGSIQLYLNGTLINTGTAPLTNITPFNTAGTYNITAAFPETQNYTASSETHFVNVSPEADTTNPSVFGLIPVQGSLLNISSTIEISANATDSSGIDTVYADVKFPNTTVQQVSLTNTAGNKYNASFSVPNLVGQYNITIIANDTEGNINNTEKTYFNAGIPPDITPPTSNFPADKNVGLGESSPIKWILQDETAPGYYYVERNGTLFDGPVQWTNNSQIIINPNNYFLGTWNYTIFYNDSSGNNGISDTVLVNVSYGTETTCDTLSSDELEEGNYPTLINITIDGNMSDWDSVLMNPENYIIDLSEGAGDLDSVATADRDIIRLAYTWDDEYLYFQWARVSSGKNQLAVLIYMDYDNDGYMNSTDQVFHVVWSGSNQQYNSYIYDYIPAGTADLMNGSGYDLPGSISLNKSLETNVVGGTNPGINLETRLKWTDIGYSGPAGINFHPASAQGGGTNIPSQIEDNLGEISTVHEKIIIRPDQTKPASNGTSVYYVHDVLNCGVLEDVVNLAEVSSQGWNVTLFYPNGSLIQDTDSDSVPDISLGKENYTKIIARIDVPGSASIGTIDNTTINAHSSIESNNASATDLTIVGDIAIIPNFVDICASQGVHGTINYTVFNYQKINDVIEIEASPDNGWNFSFYNSTGFKFNDSDSDNHTDLGEIIASESKDILLKFSIPYNETVGTSKLVTLRINSSSDPSLTATATANIDVENRITIVINENRSAGIGSATYYPLNVRNCWNESDVVDVNYTYVLNWATGFYESDMITLLTDTDNDTVPDLGLVDPYGTSKEFVLKVTVPPTALVNETETTTVYAASSSNISEFDYVTINTIAQAVVTYSDPAYTNQEDYFERGDNVYAKAFNLLDANKVYFEWIDPNATLIRTSNEISVTAENDAIDFLSTNESLLLGKWIVIVYDAQGDTEIGRYYWYLQDTSPPEINESTITPFVNSDFNQTDNVSLAFCADESVTAFANISWDSEFQIINMTYNGTEWCYEAVFTNTTYPGNYNVTFNATDASNNSVTAETNFTVNDVTAPAVQIITPAAGTNYSMYENVFITANVTDYYYSNMGTVKANITWDSTNEIITMNFNATSGLWEGTFSNTNQTGQYNITLIATDNSGNTNNTQKTYINVTTFVDLIKPNVTLNYPPANYYNDSYYPINITFNCSATDNYNLSNISLYLTDSANSSFAFNQTTSVSGTSNTTTWEIPLDFGNYTWNCIAYDTSGNFDWGENRTVKINSTIDITNDTYPPVFDDNETNPQSGEQYNQTDNVSLAVCLDENVTVFANITWDSTFEIVSLVYNGTEWCYEAVFTNTTYPGNYNVTFNAADANNNSNTTQNNFTVNDVTAPAVQIITPAAGTNYSMYENVFITANVTDYYYSNIGTVKANITWDSTNEIITMNFNATSGLWEGTFSNTNQTGQYNITLIATDNSGNTNNTQKTYINVTKAAAVCSLSFDPLSPITYGTQLNASCSCTGDGTTRLYRNETDITSENNQLITLAAGSYNYVCNTTETANYTSAQNTSAYTVNKNSTILTLIATPSWSEIYPTQTNITCTASNNEVTTQLLRNGTPVSNPDIQTLSTGNYNYTCTANSTQNYTGATAQNTLNIGQNNTAACSLTFNKTSPITYGEQFEAYCSCTNPESTPILWRNGTQITNATPQNLAAGTYEYVCNASETSNYNYAEETQNFTINKAASILNLVAQPSWIETYPAQTNVSCTANHDQANTTLTRNGTPVSNPDIQTLNTSTYNYTCTIPESQNYTGATAQNNLVITSKTVATCSLIFNPLSPITYGTQLNASCSCTGDGTTRLYRNETDITSENNQLITLAAGSYNYVCNTTETANYTSAQNTSAYTVNKNSSIVSLLLNGTDGDIDIYTGESVNITGQLTYPSQGSIQLYLNGTLINTGTAPLTNITQFNTAGTYNITAAYPETQNYTASSETHFVNVTNEPDLVNPNVTLNYPPDNFYSDDPYPVNVTFNCSATDDIALAYISLYITNSANSSFAFNQTTAVSGTSNTTTWTLSLDRGNYTWNCLAYDSSANTDWGENRSIKINSTEFGGNDTEAPSVIVIQPSNGTVFNETENITVLVNVTDNIEVDKVYAEITLQNETVITVQMLPSVGDSYQYELDLNGLIGIHNITFFANDTSNNINNSEDTYFLTSRENFLLDVVDRDWKLVAYVENVTPIGGGVYDVKIIPINNPIKEINVVSHNQLSDKWIIRIDENTSDQAVEDDFIETFSINLDYLNYTSANFTFTATGYHLFKCVDFNFTSQKCIDENHTQIMTGLVPGQNYTVQYNLTDPGFGETLEGPSNTTDSYMRSGSGGNDNFGGAEFMRVGRRNGGDIFRGILKFNLSDIPSGVQIDSANLSMYFYRIPAGDATGSRTHAVHKVQQSPARNWTELGVTWIDYDGTNAWTSAGGDYNASATDTRTFDSTALNTTITWNVTSDVQDFIANPSTNFGWIVKDSAEDTNNARRDYRTSEYTNSSQWPRLDISYTDIQNPNIILIEPSAGANFNQTDTVTITVNATDNIGIDTVLANITWDATSQLVTLSPIGGNQYQTNFTNTNYPGQYNITIIANDTSNNINNTQTTNFIINDVTAPSITIITPSNGTKYALNENITLEVNVTDPFFDSVDQVYANISWNNTSEIITLTEIGNTQIFTGNFTNTTIYGIYNITIFANDTYSNSNTKEGYFEVEQAQATTNALSCSLTDNPEVAEYGEKILFQADLSFLEGNSVMQANISEINLTIYYINSTNATIIHTADLVFLQNGIWHYEFSTNTRPNGNYMGVVNARTNSVPPKYASCSSLFTISGRGLFSFTGITPDMITVNDTLRLAAETKINSEKIDKDFIIDPSLTITPLNGTAIYLNESNSLNKKDGLIYADWEFNQTGVYHLNWTFEYYNRTKHVQEILVVNDAVLDLSNLSIDGNITNLIEDNKQMLVNLLKEMEKQQEFSAEEIFLVTDAVNSMSEVAEMLSSGELSEEEAKQQIELINRQLREGGVLVTGSSIGHGSSFNWWPVILSLLAILLFAAFTRRKARQKTEQIYTGRRKRRYEVLLSNIGFWIRRRRNKRKHSEFMPRKNSDQRRYFSNNSSERQKTLFESVSSGVTRIKQKSRHDSFAPKRQRRYEVLFSSLKKKINNAKREKALKSEREKQEKIRKELSFKKAKPKDLFKPKKETKTRLGMMIANFKEKIHKAKMRRKASKHIHKHKVKMMGRSYTKINANDLFEAIEEYKYQDETSKGMIKQDSASRLAEEYDSGIRSAVSEESRAVVVLRNGFNALKDALPAEKIKDILNDIPAPNIRLPKVRIKKPKLPDIRLPEVSMPEFKVKEKIKNKIVEIKFRKEQGKNKDSKQKPKKQSKESNKKKYRRRYQVIIDKVMKNFDDKKENEALKVLQDSVDSSPIAERIKNVEKEEKKLENDKIRYLAWNLGKGKTNSHKIIRKAFPEEEDEEAYQSSDPEIMPKPTKKDLIKKLKDIYKK